MQWQIHDDVQQPDVERLEEEDREREPQGARVTQPSTQATLGQAAA